MCSSRSRLTNTSDILEDEGVFDTMRSAVSECVFPGWMGATVGSDVVDVPGSIYKVWVLVLVVDTELSATRFSLTVNHHASHDTNVKACQGLVKAQ